MQYTRCQVMDSSCMASSFLLPVSPQAPPPITLVFVYDDYICVNTEVRKHLDGGPYLLMFEMNLVCLNRKLSTLWFLVGPSTY